MKVILFSIFRPKERREKGEKYKNSNVSQCRQNSFTPGLKNNFHYQPFAIITAAHYFSCYYPGKFPLSQTKKWFKENLSLFAPLFKNDFNSNLTFPENN